MSQLSAQLSAAKKSPFRRWILNRILWRGIPFNYPHRLSITSLNDEEVHIRIPFRRSNKNHIGSLHACVMATASEYASGLLLLQQLNPAEYRLIMQKMEVEYHYQGKTKALAKAMLSKKVVEEEVLRPFREGAESIVYKAQTKVFDRNDQHLCTAHVYWQIKPWTKVRTGKS